MPELRASPRRRCAGDQNRANPNRRQRRQRGDRSRRDETEANLAPLKLRPTERLIMWRLVEGRAFGVDEYSAAAYGMQENGGATDVPGVFDVYFWRLRLRFKSFGIEIKKAYLRCYFIEAHDLDRLRTLLADEIARNVATPSPRAWRQAMCRLARIEGTTFQRGANRPRIRIWSSAAPIAAAQLNQT